MLLILLFLFFVSVNLLFYFYFHLARSCLFLLLCNVSCSPSQAQARVCTFGCSFGRYSFFIFPSFTPSCMRGSAPEPRGPFGTSIFLGCVDCLRQCGDHSPDHSPQKGLFEALWLLGPSKLGQGCCFPDSLRSWHSCAMCSLSRTHSSFSFAHWAGGLCPLAPVPFGPFTRTPVHTVLVPRTVCPYVLVPGPQGTGASGTESPHAASLQDSASQSRVLTVLRGLFTFNYGS